MATHFYDRASPLASHVHKAEIKMLSSTSAVKQRAHFEFHTSLRTPEGKRGRMHMAPTLVQTVQPACGAGAGGTAHGGQQRRSFLGLAAA